MVQFSADDLGELIGSFEYRYDEDIARKMLTKHANRLSKQTLLPNYIFFGIVYFIGILLANRDMTLSRVICINIGVGCMALGFAYWLFMKKKGIDHAMRNPEKAYRWDVYDKGLIFLNRTGAHKYRFDKMSHMSEDADFYIVDSLGRFMLIPKSSLDEKTNSFLSSKIGEVNT